jgi:hypothetical protein
MSLLIRIGRWSAAATATAALSACGGGTKPSGAGASTPPPNTTTASVTSPSRSPSTSSPEQPGTVTVTSVRSSTPPGKAVAVCTPVFDLEHPASGDAIEAAKMIGLTLSTRQQKQSRDGIVDCERALTLHEALSAAPISVKGDAGPCYAIGLLSSPNATAPQNSTPYVAVLCYPNE